MGLRTYELTIAIKAPKKELWEALVDLDGYSLWNPVITHAGGSLQQGSSLQIKMMGREKSNPVAVKEVVRGEYFVLSRHLLHSALLHMDHCFELKPIDESTTIFTQKWECSGLLVPVLWGQLTRRLATFERFNAGLKDHLEQSTSTS